MSCSRPPFGFLLGFVVALGGGAVMLPPAAAVEAEANSRVPVITDPAWLWAMPTEQKQQVHRLRLEGRVNYYDTSYKLFWFEQNHVGTYLQLGDFPPNLRTGELVRIEGTIVPAKGLTATTTHVTVLRDYEPIDPLPAVGRINDLDALQSRVVTVEGYVDRQQKYDDQHEHLSLIVGNRPVTGWIRPDDPNHIPDWRGKFVRVQALYSARFDPTRTNTTIELWMGRQSDLQVLGSIADDAAFPGPVTPINEIYRCAAGKRIKVRGQVEAQELGAQITVRDATGQVAVHSSQRQPVPFGATIETVGRIASLGAGWILDDALYREISDTPVPGSTAANAPLRSVAQIRQLNPAEAAHGRPVLITGLVILSRADQHFFYLSDIGGGIRVRYDPATMEAPPLDKFLEVEGTTYQDRFTPAVEMKRVRDLGAMSPPAAHSITYDQAITGKEDGQWVTLRGFLRRTVIGKEYQSIHITNPEGEFVGSLSILAPFAANPGALLRVRGVCEANTGPDGRISGFTVWIPTSSDIMVAEEAPADFFDLPQSSLSGIKQLSATGELMRVRVAGTVLHAVPGHAVYMAEGGVAQLLLSSDPTPLVPGDRIEAVGILGREGARTILREAVLRKTGSGPPPAATPLAAAAPLSVALDSQLVRVRGTLLDRFDGPDRTRFTLQADNTLFEALLNRRGTAPLPDYEMGAGLELTGIYKLEFDDSRQLRSFHLLLRSPADVVMFRSPRFWTVWRALVMAGILGGCMVLVLAWVTALRRRVNRQTAQIRAQLERQAQLEAEVQHAARLESLGILAGGIAHDFNNLLTSVLGNASLAGTELNPPATGECLREIERGARRACELTQQLLTFAKGGAPLRTSVALSEVVRQAVDFVLHSSAVRCEYRLAPDLWNAHIDREQIAQAIRNLALNAMQAMPQGGVLCLSLQNERVTEGAKTGLAAGRYLKLVVADTGAGLDPDILPRIFDPYFSMRREGGGLGLATVYSIVRRHQGRIEVESAPGRGTAFCVWLPASTDSPPPFAINTAPPAPAAACAADRKPRVLVLDDEESIRRILEIVLQRLGVEPVIVADGAAALRAYEEARASGRPLDLLILDLTVPGGLGGRQVIERIRRRDTTTPAVVASGYSNDPVLAHFGDYGFQAVVPKPFDVTQLTGVIRRFVACMEAGGAGS